MRGKGERFRHAVSKTVQQRSNRNFFLTRKYDASYTKVSTQQRKEGIEKLHKSLPQGRDIIYRGTEGIDEVVHAMRSNRLGVDPKESKKSPSLDLVGYIRENNSKFFLSFSPCQATVQPYAAGLSLIPCKGFIWVTGLPKVFTRPQELLCLNPELFRRYDEFQLEQQDRDNPQRYDPISSMTANNNEITMLLASGDHDDWRPVVGEDVMKLVQVSGPGKFLGPFMSSNEPMHVTDWENPDFKKRVWSLDIVLSGGFNYREGLEQMNERAQQFGLILPDQRLLTIEDAQAVVNSKELNSLNEEYTTDETHILKKVPAKIAIGDAAALIDYMTHEVKSEKKLVEIDVSAHSLKT